MVSTSGLRHLSAWLSAWLWSHLANETTMTSEGERPVALLSRHASFPPPRPPMPRLSLHHPRSPSFLDPPLPISSFAITLPPLRHPPAPLSRHPTGPFISSSAGLTGGSSGGWREHKTLGIAPTIGWIRRSSRRMTRVGRTAGCVLSTVAAASAASWTRRFNRRVAREGRAGFALPAARSGTAAVRSLHS